jgi:hypothetical protein
MKKLLVMCLVLTGCSATVIRHPGMLSMDVVCFNGTSDCELTAMQTCPRGYDVIRSTYRTEGRAGDDAAAVRVVQTIVCR